MRKFGIGILLITWLSSFNTETRRVKDGYYSTSHGHASVLFKIRRNKIEWYRDNVFKAWGSGTYEINIRDSVMIVSLNKVWISDRQDTVETFDSILKLEWDETESIFMLHGFHHREDDNGIIERVRKSCKIKVRT